MQIITIPKLFPLYLLASLIVMTAFRNLSAIYYLLLGLGFVPYLAGNLKDIFIFNRAKLPFFIFLYSTGFIILWSFFYLLSMEPLVGIPRVLLMPLLSFIFIYHLKTDEDFKSMLLVILFCFVLGSLSLVYQFIFDPISWFAPPATRGVLIRYSSVLGSLTVFGTIAGYFLILIFGPINLLKTFFKRLIVFAILIIGVAISLQKTAIFITLISLLILFLYNIRFKGLKIKLNHLALILSFLFLAPILIATNPDIQKYVSTLLIISTGIDLSSFSSSVVSITDVRTSTITWYEIGMRLYGFGFNLYEYYGNFIWFFGVGLKGGAGVMGMDGYSSHNGLLDLLAMGGPLYLISFLYLYFYVQKFLYKNLADNLAATFFLLNCIFIIVAIPTAGAVFQPSVSIIFWTSIAYVYCKSMNVNN